MRLTGLLFTLLALMLLPATAHARDRDGDRLPDRWEAKFHLSTKSKSGSRDPDGDGLSNRGEFLSRTSPRRADSDRDRVRDDDEDPDRDRVDNGNEVREGTRPRDRDSDGDRRPDGREDRDRDGLRNAAEDVTGNDPKDRDSDNDGVGDAAENAGTVKSFVAGLLTIDLGRGKVVAGLVTPATDFTCESEDELESFQHRVRTARMAATDEDGDRGDEDFGDDPDPIDPDDGPEDDDNSVDDGPEGGSGTCTASDLVPGSRVHEAKGSPAVGTLLFSEIELVR